MDPRIQIFLLMYIGWIMVTQGEAEPEFDCTGRVSGVCMSPINCQKDFQEKCTEEGSLCCPERLLKDVMVRGASCTGKKCIRLPGAFWITKCPKGASKVCCNSDLNKCCCRCKRRKMCRSLGGECTGMKSKCIGTILKGGCKGVSCFCCVPNCTLKTKCKKQNGQCRTTECKAKEIELPKGCKGDGCKCCIKTTCISDKTCVNQGGFCTTKKNCRDGNFSKKMCLGRFCGCCIQACGVVNKQVRIVGGEETLVHEYPWQAALVFEGGSDASCGASILSHRWILTAAHCFDDSKNPSKYHVVVGEHDWTTSDETTFTERFHVEQLVLHPKFHKPTSFNNDIALIKLTSQLTFTQQNHVAPICLPPLGTQDKFKNIDAIVSGWGALDYYEEISPDVLHDVTVSTISNGQCQKFYKSRKTITDGMICARVPKGGKDSCQGDSGGPLVTEADEGGRMVQIGVVSFGEGCGDRKFPGVYARVSHYMPWILSHMDDAA